MELEYFLKIDHQPHVVVLCTTQTSWIVTHQVKAVVSSIKGENSEEKDHEIFQFNEAESLSVLE